MSYTKHTWTSGEVITAENLNHIEDGVEDAGSGGGSSVLLITQSIDGEYIVSDKTWQEIYDCVTTGGIAYTLDPFYLPDTATIHYVKSVFISNNSYFVSFDDSSALTASSANDYPQRYMG